MAPAGRTMNIALFLLIFALINVANWAQSPRTSDSAAAPVQFTARQDQENMIRQLGIHALRPGRSGDERAPDHANYDESQANPFPKIPDALTLRDGTKVTTPELWQKRRAEIVEGFERSVYG